MRKTLLFLAAVFTVVAAEQPAPKFRAVEIDNKVQIGYGLAIADMDGDKKPDIVLADKTQIVWYRNPDWNRFVLAENLTKLDNVCVAARDLNGDGKAEVAVGAGWNPGDTVGSGAVFYLIPPADRTQKWEPVQLPHEPTVHRMRWVRTSQGRFELVVVPLHGRGNKAGQGEGVKILAYKIPGNPKERWHTEVIDASSHMTHNFNPLQWDRDPGEEMLLASKEGVYVLDESGGKWSRKPLTGGADTGFSGAGEVRSGRLPGGTRYVAMVEPMHGNQLVVYAAGPVSGPWNRHVLNSELIEGHALACGDLSGAGYDQIVIGWRGKAPGDKVGIRIYSTTDKAGKDWKSDWLDDNGMACEDLVLADLDGDHRLDVVAAGRATKNLKIYFNDGAK